MSLLFRIISIIGVIILALIALFLVLSFLRVSGLFDPLSLFYVSAPKTPEVVAPKSVQPRGRVLVLYHQGMSTQVTKATNRIASLLADAGYECTTDSVLNKTEHDIEAYDMLIFGAPTYADKPPLQGQRRLSSLPETQGKPAAVFATAGTTPQGCVDYAASALQKKGYAVASKLGLAQEDSDEKKGEQIEGFVREIVGTLSGK